jgi:DNA-binding GntR family transcriptional regulator
MMTRSKSATAPTDQQIYDRIYDAILERRLQPGVPLRENDLATMFGVGRTKVRQALVKLVEVGVVQVERNRGASVATPTKLEAGQVFDLRTMLEPAIAAALASGHSREQIARLRAHIAKEQAARQSQDEALLIRLTGEFHLLLAAQLGNPLVDRLLKGLEALTCLSILSYSRRDACACLPHEHTDILDAVAAGDAVKAGSLMATHLGHVRDDLDLEERAVPARDLGAALGLGVHPPVGRRRGRAA